MNLPEITMSLQVCCASAQKLQARAPTTGLPSNFPGPLVPDNDNQANKGEGKCEKEEGSLGLSSHKSLITVANSSVYCNPSWQINLPLLITTKKAEKK